MEYGQKVTLTDITCPDCQGQLTGAATCNNCGKEVLYTEQQSVTLEKEGYSVDPTHRNEEAFKQWYIENGKKNSKLYKTGQGLSKTGNVIQEGSGIVNSFANVLLWGLLLIIIAGVLMLLL